MPKILKDAKNKTYAASNVTPFVFVYDDRPNENVLTRNEIFVQIRTFEITDKTHVMTIVLGQVFVFHHLQIMTKTLKIFVLVGSNS